MKTCRILIWLFLTGPLVSVLGTTETDTDEAEHEIDERGPHIVNGDEADPHKWPWQGLLKHNGRFVCGATLYKRDIAITAAHCVQESGGTYSLVLGEHDKSQDDGPEQEISVTTVLSHPGYDDVELKHDIALLYLQSKATINGAVKVIPKLSTRKLDAQAVESEKCYVVGWGIWDEGQTETPDKLQQIKTNVLNNKECDQKFKDEGINLVLFKQNVCSYNKRGGFCNGDSGGTLQCKIKGKWTHVGIVSWYYNTCIDNVPKAYTRVSSYKKWIKKET